jgi:hypothetical protein
MGAKKTARVVGVERRILATEGTEGIPSPASGEGKGEG